MKKISVFLIVFAILVVFAFDRAVTRPNELNEKVFVIVPKGAGLGSVSDILHKENVVSNPLIFKVLGRVNGMHKTLKAGEYEFLPKMSMVDVMKKMARGEVYSRKITFPEGITTRQFLDIVRDAEFLSGEISVEVKEGELLPETYTYTRGTSRNEVIERAKNAMEKVKSEAWANRETGLPLKNINEMMILASIIEKEAFGPTAMSNISSVLHNRLDAGMQLQCDVTIIYVEGAIKPFISGDVNRYNSYYNTYKCPALPAGAICNPGLAAIESALNPANTNYFYFVTDKNNNYYWAETWAGHEENVAYTKSIA